jgi:hypothetical protein
MLDNLRDNSSSKPFFEDEAEYQPADLSAIPAAPRRRGRFLGMTPMQRFVIAVLMMIMVCLLGTMCAFVTGRMGIYF